jgi:hypothetical protein
MVKRRGDHSPEREQIMADCLDLVHFFVSSSKPFKNWKDRLGSGGDPEFRTFTKCS